MKSQRIRTTTDYKKIALGGCLDGKGTYLRFECGPNVVSDALTGHKLYRLAKAIVRQFETVKK